MSEIRGLYLKVTVKTVEHTLIILDIFDLVPSYTVPQGVPRN
jgi:hypothetical protein